jgi:RimJ/RimL family protein N-acetyltransferase
MKPILIDLPDRIETARLFLRAPRFGDGAAINAAVIESLAHLRPWMPWAQDVPSIEASEEFARSASAKFISREELPYLAFLKNENKYLGGTGLHRINWDVPRFEIGYWIRASEQGKGYVSEAVIALTDFCFERLKANRVEIRMDDKNERSWRVAERCGFALEGLFRNDTRDHFGVLRDTRIYALSK